MTQRRRGAVGAGLIVVLVAAAAVAFASSRSDSPDQSAPLVVADPFQVYDPVTAGEPLPDGYRIGLARDQIAPVYEPAFTSADRVDWPNDSLVIGVAGESEAKAYPVTHLNSREMVVDSLEGIPILVTW